MAGVLAPPAAAATNCSFNLLTRSVSVEVQGDPTPTDEGVSTIALDGNLITVNGSTCTFLVIPATVLNTDTIVVTGSSGHEQVRLFPGLASAGILVEVDLAEQPTTAPQYVRLEGTDGPDLMIVGAPGADQDGDGDVDVTIAETTSWLPLTGDGDDVVTGQGFDVAPGQCGAGTGGATERRMYILAGPGNDTLIGGLSADNLLGGPGDDYLDGCEGANTARYDNANPEADGVTGVTVNLVAGSTTGGDGNDTLVNIVHVLGSQFNDTLSGDGGNNTLEGLGGCDSIDGGDGTDRVSYNNAPGPVEVDLRFQSAMTPDCDLEEFGSIESALGSHFDDTIIGDDGPNSLQGLSGIDILIGLDGNDALHGGDGNDAVGGGAGDDIIWPG
ncbi:MAG: calcium-binding protein, partial [Vicinamibacteraceae bacterium]